MSTAQATNASNGTQIDFETLNELAGDKIEEILDSFGVVYDYSHGSKNLFGSCPIHDGDNPRAFAMRVDTGKWGCYTQQCHKKRPGQGTILNFVFLMLEKDNPKITLWGAVQYLKQIIGFDGTTGSLIISEADLEKKKFIRQSQTNQISVDGTTPRGIVRSRLIIPAQYYLDKGYQVKTLVNFDVGLCLNRNSNMYERVVVPIYDEHYKLIAFTGRSIHTECPKCKGHHDLNKQCISYSEKWLNSKGFPKGNILYNYHEALPFINESGTAYLVEGAGDVWRMWEAGYKNTLGLLGSSLGFGQLALLSQTGATSLVILTDFDQAGMNAKQKIEEQVHKMYNLKCPNLPTKDVGEMSVEDIKGILG